MRLIEIFLTSFADVTPRLAVTKGAKEEFADSSDNEPGLESIDPYGVTAKGLTRSGRFWIRIPGASEECEWVQINHT